MNGAHISATTSKPSKVGPVVFTAALLNIREGVFRYLVNLVIISMSTNVAPSRVWRNEDLAHTGDDA